MAGAGPLMLLFAPLTVLAQQTDLCRPPNPMPVPRPVPIPRGEAVVRHNDGGYILALSWSAQYCATVRNPNGARDKDQCAPAMGGFFNRSPSTTANFGWVLHGLWPQSATGPNPQWCRAARIVPKDVLRKNFCVSPSVHLMQYQWAKHGSCMSPTPQLYFETGARLFRAMHFPNTAQMAQSPQNSASIRRAFARHNAGTTANMYAVHADRRGWLREVRLCLNKAMRPSVCPAERRGMVGNRPIFIRSIDR